MSSQKIFPMKGISSDISPAKLPADMARFLKNVEQQINIVGGQIGQTFGKKTPILSNSTNFPTSLLPQSYTYSIDLSGQSFPFNLFGYLSDYALTNTNTTITDDSDLDTYFSGLGFTKTGTGRYSKTSSIIWQNVLIGDDGATPVLFTKSSAIAFIGNNTCVGSYAHENANVAVWLNYNSAGRHHIIYYDVRTNTYSKLLETPVLKFNPLFRITGINIIQINSSPSSDNALETLLYWTEGLNNPRKINMTKMLAGGYFSLAPYWYRTSDEFYRADKYPPDTRITGEFSLDSSTKSNYLNNSFFQVAYRFWYDDGEKSTWSLYSTLFFTNDFLGANFQLINNLLTLSNISAGSQNVIKIELAIRIGNGVLTVDTAQQGNIGGQWFSYDILNRAQAIAGDITGVTYDATTNLFTYKFYNNKSQVLLDQTRITGKLFESLPLRAKAQELLNNNVIGYSNILPAQYANLTAAQRAIPTISIAYTSIAIISLAITGSVNFLFTSTGAGEVEAATVTLQHKSASTGIITAVHAYAFGTTTDGGGLGNVIVPISDTINNITIYDTVYLQVTGLILTAGATLQINSPSNLAGAYTNATPAGNGDFSVELGPSTPVLALNANVLFRTIISDPQNTWGIDTGIHTDPNNEIPAPGLKSSGLYDFGFTVYDEALRSTFIQASPDLQLAIQSIMEAGGNFTSLITWAWNNLVFPDWAKYVSVSRTQNLAIQRELFKGFIQWKVSNVQYFDSNNNVVSATIATKVKFDLTSLSTFNDNNFGVTNTSYDFTPRDVVRFMTINGRTNNNILIERQLRNNNTDLDFYVDMDTNLLGFFDGDIIELYTPASQQGTNKYFEITGLFPLTGVPGNNQAVTQTFTLDTFDTYLINRSGYVDVLAPANVTFSLLESPFRSDLIVDCAGEDIGRINIINPDAAQNWNESITVYSGAYSKNSFVNALNVFDDSAFVQNPQIYGGITKTKQIQNVLHIIAEDGCTKRLVGKQVVTLADGTEVMAAANVFLSNLVDVGGVQAGCQNPETFDEKYGLMFYWDVKRGAIIMHNGSSQEDITMKQMGDKVVPIIKGYINSISKLVYQNEAVGELPMSGLTTMIHGVIDPLNDRYLVSIFPFNNNGQVDDDYINNEYDYSNSLKTTFGYNIKDGTWSGFYSFVPEFYLSIDSSIFGSVFMSFKKGRPYIHNNINETTYNTFYGTMVDSVVTIVCNDKDSLVKVMRHLAIEDNDIAWFSPKVTTSKTDQLSKMPIEIVEQGEGIWYTTFKQDMNSIGGLVDGDDMRGVYAIIQLVRDTTQQNVYSELNNIIVYYSASELSDEP